jgi:hypothetical protein
MGHSMNIREPEVMLSPEGIALETGADRILETRADFEAIDSQEQRYQETGAGKYREDLERLNTGQRCRQGYDHSCNGGHRSAPISILIINQAIITAPPMARM